MAALTGAQLSLLRKVAAEPQAVRPRRPSAQAIWLWGLVEWDGEAGDGLWWLNITDAGRAILASFEEASPQ